MHLNFSRNKKPWFFVLCLIVFSSCKQSEFYEKEGLSEISRGDPNPGIELPTPPVTEPPVTEPPVVNPPVTEPPVVITPPVTEPPVTEPPVTPDPGVLLDDRTEHFTQNISKSGVVDILWIIDDSGSMSDEQADLAKNFTSFITQFLDKDVDFKMGITTTDPTSSKNGRMVGDSNLLTSAAAKANRQQFINNFTKWVKVGINGSGNEQGLKTSVSFMDRYGASFLRPDAYLAIVYISDEEDFSPKKVQDYLDALQALKKNKGMVKAYSIVTVKNYGNSWESIGTRYIAVAEQTAGVVSDIKQNFSGTLLKIGERIVNLLDSFALNEAPYNNQIEVYVNNIKVETGYSFLSEERLLKFDKSALPAEGSKVEVRYKVKAKVLGAI